MTRTQFDTRFAATLENTDGYTAVELAELNAEVFAAVADVDADAPDAHQLVKSAFDAAHAAR
jgi:hypothetical protein